MSLQRNVLDVLGGLIKVQWCRLVFSRLEGNCEQLIITQTKVTRQSLHQSECATLAEEGVITYRYLRQYHVSILQVVVTAIHIGLRVLPG